MLPFAVTPSNPESLPLASMAGDLPLMLIVMLSIEAAFITQTFPVLPKDRFCGAMPVLIATSPTPPLPPFKQCAYIRISGEGEAGEARTVAPIFFAQSSAAQ